MIEGWTKLESVERLDNWDGEPATGDHPVVALPAHKRAMQSRTVADRVPLQAKSRTVRGSVKQQSEYDATFARPFPI